MARSVCRGVAQPGRAPGSGPGGRRFKSSLPDHFKTKPLTRDSLQGWILSQGVNSAQGLRRPFSAAFIRIRSVRIAPCVSRIRAEPSLLVAPNRLTPDSTKNDVKQANGAQIERRFGQER